ncbi:MAG TPA: hypothetical protein GX506_09380 [Firmicutes bacterium]|nr:hypothetical protein [Bacillota bacterium]
MMNKIDMHTLSIRKLNLPLSPEAVQSFVLYACARLWDNESIRFLDEYTERVSIRDDVDFAELAKAALETVQNSEIRRKQIAQKVAKVMFENGISPPDMSLYELEYIASKVLEELEDSCIASDCESLASEYY